MSGTWEALKYFSGTPVTSCKKIVIKEQDQPVPRLLSHQVISSSRVSPGEDGTQKDCLPCDTAKQTLTRVEQVAVPFLELSKL